MFGFFKRKTKIERLKEEYRVLMDKAYKASKTNRRLSDEYAYKANEIEKLILEFSDDPPAS
jgi:hypothetical protein|tara:strand:+ start:1226 stop:1408 length:183 start_codon:yes stop_codon:yes gene_type:complete